MLLLIPNPFIFEMENLYKLCDHNFKKTILSSILLYRKIYVKQSVFAFLLLLIFHKDFVVLVNFSFHKIEKLHKIFTFIQKYLKFKKDTPKIVCLFCLVFYKNLRLVVLSIIML